MRRSSLFALVGLLFVLLIALSAWTGWRRRPGAIPPAEVAQVAASGAFEAGSARRSLVVDFPVPVAGYPGAAASPSTDYWGNIHTRALVVRAASTSLCLVSIDALLIPAELQQTIARRAQDAGFCTDVWVGATHTHSGPGGYWDHPLARWAALGRYEPRIFEWIVSQTVSALGDAAHALRPARISSARIEASHYGSHRGGPGVADDQLSVLRVDASDGAPIGRLVVYGVHPTMVPPESGALSADWPGSLAETLESDNGTVLVWQGAGADVTWAKRQGSMSPRERVERMGRAMAADVRGAIAAAGEGEGSGVLTSARLQVGLPPSDAGGIVWGPFEPPVSILLDLVAHPGTTTVGAFRVGTTSFVLVPGELVADLGVQWRDALGGSVVATVVGDYVGYIEQPTRFEAEEGESRHQYFDAALAPRLFDALRRVHAALVQRL